MMVLLHHTLFYFLEVFNFAHVLITLLKIAVASVFSITACLLFIYLFGGSKK
jgi:rod shape-determining protein mreD